MNGHFGGGKGTLANPYLIEDIWDFDNIRHFPNKSFKLTKNINFATPPFNDGFLPIAHFEGQLDGDGHKLMNVYINKSNMDNVGIFSLVDFALTNYQDVSIRPHICNLVIENANVIGGKSSAGILIGAMNYHYNWGVANYGEYLNNIYVSGTVSGYNYNGALIGYLYFEHDNWQNTFAKNIQCNVVLKPQLNLTYNSPLFGYIKSNEQSYINTIELIKDSFIEASIDDSLVTLSMNNCSSHVNSNAGQNDTYHYRCNNVILNQDKWNGKHSTYINEMTYADICLAYKMSGFKSNITDINKWYLRYNIAPQLLELNNNLYFVSANNKFYTYDSDKDLFNQVYIFDYEQAVANKGITNLSDLSVNFFKSAHKTFGDSYKIVNIIDKNNGVILNNDTEIVLTRDATKDYDSKYVYRKKVSFSTITGDIDSIVDE